MAAIDKIYIKEYYQYDDLLRWSLIYYPKLINYFYNIHMTYKDFEKARKDYVNIFKKNNKKLFEQIGKTFKLQKAAKNLKKHYKESANYDAFDEQCFNEAKEIIKRLRLKKSQIENSFLPFQNNL